MAKLTLTTAQKAIADQLDTAIEQAWVDGVTNVMDGDPSCADITDSTKTKLKESIKRTLLPLVSKLSGGLSQTVTLLDGAGGTTDLVFSNGILVNVVVHPPIL